MAIIVGKIRNFAHVFARHVVVSNAKSRISDLEQGIRTFLVILEGSFELFAVIEDRTYAFGDFVDPKKPVYVDHEANSTLFFVVVRPPCFGQPKPKLEPLFGRQVAQKVRHAWGLEPTRHPLEKLLLGHGRFGADYTPAVVITGVHGHGAHRRQRTRRSGAGQELSCTPRVQGARVPLV